MGWANLHSIGAHGHEWLRLAADDILVHLEFIVTAEDLEIREFASCE